MSYLPVPTYQSVGIFEVANLLADRYNAARTAPIESQIATIEQFRAAVASEWPTNVTAYPPAFIEDLLGYYLDKVVDPMSKMVQSLANESGSRPASLRAAWDRARRTWDAVLLPSLHQAISERDAGTDWMFEPTLRASFLASLGETTSAFREMVALVRERNILFKLGPVTDAWLSFMKTSMQMFVRVAETIESAGEIVYRPLAKTAEILTALVKISLIGVAGLVAYYAFKSRGES